MKVGPVSENSSAAREELPSQSAKSVASTVSEGLNAAHRVIYANDPAANATQQFCTNAVTTSKYNPLNFLPKFLFETFRKVANLYFLLVSVMQTIEPISNTSSVPTCLPVLIFIVAVDAMFAILEDARRHKADKVANAKACLVLDTASRSFATRAWRDIVVGDIIKIHNRDIIPADIMIVSVSESPDAPPTGICYVETKSLDGETNLKMRQALEGTLATCRTEEDFAKLKGKVTCEQPNKAISKFTGTWNPEGKLGEPVPAKSVLLRGCVLRNTVWAVGMVINTGHDTKIMMNSTETPSKQSSTDKMINAQIFMLVIVLAITCILGASGSIMWIVQNESAWYLDGLTHSLGLEWFRMVFYYFLLNYQFIPVSLYVSMASVKFLQSLLVNNDIEMYHEETNTPALTRNMILNEELGQISYIFSDKTGTLTCNIMEFRKCSINGISYGRGTTEIGLAALRRAGKPIPAEALEKDGEDSSGRPRIPYVNFCAPDMFADLEGARGDLQQLRIEQFFTHLAVCHTVIPEKLENDVVVFSASSPDEQALVSGAKFCGFDFFNRTPGFAEVKIGGKNVKFQILDVLEFTSTRKRMSCVIRHPETGKLSLLCKGADAVIIPRLDTKNSQETVKATMDHMESFAEDGLRTLAIAIADLDEEWFKIWQGRFHDALASIEEIEKRKRDLPNKIDQCMEDIEKNLTLIGATAIEDKLQDGVPDAISNLAEGGIKIWVLTGDKQETAINIGFACQLLNNDMDLVIIDPHRYPTAEAIRELCDYQAQRAAEAIKRRGIESSAVGSHHGSSFQDVSLVIDGEALEIALQDECKMHLLNFAQYCKAVVACRVSPAQKAQMVTLVRENVPNVRTLAIGDGANDVGMIQAAHVGVGISGQEGMQAVNSSDYAIAQFRFLSRLLLVHGRWNYNRMCILVCYMFYKNIVLVLSQYWYTYFTGCSGQKFYNEVGVQLYNVCYTAFPVLILAVYDRDVRDTMALKFPKLYYAGPAGNNLNRKVFWSWVASAVYESLIICFITTFSYSRAAYMGTDMNMWGGGLTAFTLAVVVVNVKLLAVQKSFHYFHILFYSFGSLLWMATEGYISQSTFLSDLDTFGLFDLVHSTLTFWCLLVFVIVATSGVEFAFLGYRSIFDPSYSDLCREVEAVPSLDESGLEWFNSPVVHKAHQFVPLNSMKGATKIHIAPASKQSDDELRVEELRSGESVNDNQSVGTAGGVTLQSVVTVSIAPRKPLKGFAFSNDAETTRAEAAFVAKGRSSTSAEVRALMSQATRKISRQVTVSGGLLSPQASVKSTPQTASPKINLTQVRNKTIPVESKLA